MSHRERNVAAYLIGLLVSISLALVVVLVALAVQSERLLDCEGPSWSLAALFGRALNDAIDTQIKARSGRPSSPPSCRLGYVPLGELRPTTASGERHGRLGPDVLADILSA
jgi:hypothetical protein